MKVTWLSELPSTNFKAVAVVVLTLLTAFGSGLMMWFAKPIDESIFITWLAFLGSLWGINFMQFWMKRKTQFDPGVSTSTETHKVERALSTTTDTTRTEEPTK